ncbi:hypothetical protein [Yoonia sp.]|uniref:hypothetical protein n=1 Tax=Yoonia sp. TaxID=2212373 RepID=UPI003F6B6FAB
MANAYVDKVANELADMALADQKASGDIGIVDMIGDVLGASSQTLQETYLTAIRVRRAEERARTILAERAASGYQAPVKTNSATLPDDTAQTGEAAAEDASDAPEDPATQAAPATPPSGTMPRRVTR